MSRWIKKNKQIFATVIAILLVIALVAGSISMFFIGV